MSLKTISSPRLFETIAAQVRDLIKDEDLALGAKLPNERELAQRFGVSRHAVREAFRSLEVTGWIELRKGATGGTFVSTGRPEVFTEIIERLIQSRELSIEGLTEARLIVELSIIDALSGKVTDDLMERLEANINEAERLTKSGKWAEKTEANIQFHILLAEGADNIVVEMVMGALMAVLRHLINEFGSVMGLDVIASRRRFLDCVRNNDIVAAREEMRRHLIVLHERYVDAASNVDEKG
jgi:DNA-binding FadR family transcriptional regulator